MTIISEQYSNKPIVIQYSARKRNVLSINAIEMFIPI